MSVSAHSPDLNADHDNWAGRDSLHQLQLQLEKIMDITLGFLTKTTECCCRQFINTWFSFFRFIPNSTTYETPADFAFCVLSAVNLLTPNAALLVVFI